MTSVFSGLSAFPDPLKDDAVDERASAGLVERLAAAEVDSIPAMSKDEHDSLLETTYLLRSPKNARRLIDAFESARAGNVTEHDLEE